MTSRLFVALPIPEAVRDGLELFIGPRRDADPGLRWVRSENWHLTLAFLGDVADERVDSLTEALSEVANRTPAFRLGLFGGGAFPHPGAAKVLWLGVDPGGTEPASLAARVRRACDRAGVRVDGAKFTGHLTLARAPRPLRVDRWLTILDALPPLAWAAHSFSLVESRLNRGGSVYRDLATLSLALPAAPIPEPASANHFDPDSRPPSDQP